MTGSSTIHVSRWTACHGSTLVWQSWDEPEWIVYHVESGDTHLLNEVAAQALRILQGGSFNASELAEQIAAALDCDADEAFTQQLQRLLAEFDESGLIERCL